MTATEMNAAVDRIVKLAHALTQLREQLARCEGVTAHARVALASAQAAHRRAEADEEAARAALVAALGAAPDAAPPPADVPPALVPERATSPADPDGPVSITLLEEDLDRLIADKAVADAICWTGEETEIEWAPAGNEYGFGKGRPVVASDAVDGDDLARIRRVLGRAGIWWVEAIPGPGGKVLREIEAAPRKPHQAEPVEKPAPDARQPDIEKQAPAAAAKQPKPPRKPRPSECWTVREYAANGAPVETFRGGKVDAEQHYRAREKELTPGERAELVSPKGVVLVHCTGKVPAAPALRWHVETRDVGADAWNAGSFGYDDEAEARREYQYALDNSKPGEAVRLRRPGGGHEGEVTVPETAATTDAPPVAEMSAEALERALRLAVDVAELKSIWFDNAKKVDVAGLKRASEVFRERVVALGGTAGDDAAPAEGVGASDDDDARCDELLRTRTRHPHVVLAWPGGGGAGPDWGVVFEGATLGSALKAQRAAVKRLRGTGGRVRRYENAALVETLPVAPGGGAARPAGGAAATAAAEVSP